MEIFPAIDLKNGNCVRLVQGDYNKETIYFNNPVEVAKKWNDKGATNLHVVDLDGAAEGLPVNIKIIEDIIKNIPDVNVQVGGGIRTNNTVQQLVNAGVKRVIIGTKAVKNPEWVEELCGLFPGQIAISIDLKNGFIATQGWLETEGVKGITFAKEMQKHKPCAMIVTDISKDGMLKGPNLDLMKEFKAEVGTPVIASGGVTSIEDIENLKEIDVYGAIIGKSLYDNMIDLSDAIKICKN